MSNLTVVNIVVKKSEAKALTKDEIVFFVRSVVNSIRSDAYPAVPAADPCQIGAMMMACFLKGLSDDETMHLTNAMKTSGNVLTWDPEWRHLLVDKHSTGGVGDTVSLILAPALAALGMKVPMISGRSLGLTGGTLDKLESIPGFRVELSAEEMARQLEDVGCCIVGQTEDLVPADKVLYRCRDMTGTVNSSSLIIASIVSKKLAENIGSLVYDVKFGSGTHIKTKEEAVELGKKLVYVSNEVSSSALITAMHAPLGMAIGNSLEVLEAIDCLKGSGPREMIELVEELGGELMRLSNRCETRLEGEKLIQQVLQDGSALRKFHDMMKYQGVSESVAEDLCFRGVTSALPKSEKITIFNYHGPPGCISEIDAASLAKVFKEEISKKECIDHGVGLTLQKHIGDFIETGDPWLAVHHSSELSSSQLKDIENALSISQYKECRKKRTHYLVTKVNGEIIVIEEKCVLDGMNL